MCAIANIVLALAASTYLRMDNAACDVLAAAKPAAAPAACVFPTAPAAIPEETAWRLFIAANCPSNSNKVVWENWVEQLQLYPASGTTSLALAEHAKANKRLHGSPLARAEMRRLHLAAPLLAPTTQCNKMKGPPPNVIKDATVCEEVHLNPEAQQFVASNGYQIRPGQTAAAQKGTDIEFPQPAIEVKVDWIPATDFNPPFTCSKPPTGVHVETIDGVCYAMVGMHMSSKLLKNWVWATFEPQSMLTNPLRCTTFGPCTDSWGSNPATSSGGADGFTAQTQATADLMKQGNLAPEFFNYRLDGVQIDFTGADGKPTFLGNSIIEGENVGLKMNQSSCITCHSVSSIKSDGLDGFNTFINLPNPPVGRQYQVSAGWIARDFVWSMGLACPDNGGEG